MATITAKEWNNYVAILRKLDGRAYTEMRAMLARLKIRYEAGEMSTNEFRQRLIDYAYALVTKYGEGASAAACEMYDAVAAVQGVTVPAAIPAGTATIAETAKVVNGTLKTGNAEIVASAVGRLVKQAAADTTLQNAKRDGAYFAWISHGDTCPYCLALAGLGWRKAGKLTLKGGHAEHIHSNCDCEYAIDFRGDLEIEGYSPQEINQTLLELTDDEYNAEDLIRMSGHGRHNHEALNTVRRKIYAKNKEAINEQKRSAYAKRVERNSSASEELNVD